MTASIEGLMASSDVAGIWKDVSQNIIGRIGKGTVALIRAKKTCAGATDYSEQKRNEKLIRG
jgi:hypothetical protein